MKKRSKKRIAWLTTIGIIFAILIGFFGWTSFYYHADTAALTFAKQDSTILKDGDWTILPEENSTAAVIFYPGAKVESISYLPILEKIREQAHVTCILVHMPLNLAIFNVNAADAVIQKHSEIQTWYIAGHSLGGAMSSTYAAKHSNQIKGLILMGSYLYGDYPVENTITIYGSLNAQVKDKITYTENVVCIDGGNHAQFGNYGKQKGDTDASISSEVQQNITAAAIASFIHQ